MNELSSKLNNMPIDERDDILEYYDELIEDTIDKDNKSEEEAIASLGSIDSIVRRVSGSSDQGSANNHKIHYDESDESYKEENEEIDEKDVEIVDGGAKEKKTRLAPPTAHRKTEDKASSKPKTDSSKNNDTVIRILIVVLTFPIWIGIVTGLFGCVIGFGCAGFGIGIGGIAAAIAGACRLSYSLQEGIFTMGIGSVLFGISLIITPSLVKLMVYLVKQLCKLVKWIVKGN